MKWTFQLVNFFSKSQSLSKKFLSAPLPCSSAKWGCNGWVLTPCGWYQRFSLCCVPSGQGPRMEILEPPAPWTELGKWVLNTYLLEEKKAPSSVVMFKLMAHVLKPSLVLSIQTKKPLSDAYPLIMSFLQPLQASLSHQIQIVFIFFKPRKLFPAEFNPLSSDCATENHSNSVAKS